MQNTAAKPVQGLNKVQGGGVQSAGGDPFFSSVVFLSHFDGTNGQTTATDQKGHAITMTGATLTTSTVKAGTASVRCLGASTPSINCANSADWDFGFGDHTIELFFFPTAGDTNFRNLIAFDFVGTAPWTIAYSNTANGLQYFGRDTTFAGISILGGVVSLSNWHHVAVTRQGSNFKMFLDGNQVGSTATNSNAMLTDPNGLTIAQQVVSITDFILDEIRITKGVARYTSNFTPPSVPFPNS